MSEQIFWWPISELPDTLKDGQVVLVWTQCGEAQLVTWNRELSCWWNDERMPIDDATHFAEMDAPEDWRSEMIHLGY